MGSFNVGCGLSNLSINEGDSVGFLLLGEAPSYHSELKPKEGRTGYVYTDELYLPYLPPVFAVYADYGGVENLRPNITTRVLEDIFDRPALAVINAIGGGRTFYDTYSGAVSLYLPEDTREKLRSYELSDIQKFEALGFKQVTPQPGFEEALELRGYRLEAKVDNTMNLPPEYRILTWSLFGPQGKLFEDVRAVNGPEQVLTSFAMSTKILPGYLESDWERIWTLSSLNGMFFLEDVYKGLRSEVMDNLTDYFFNFEEIEQEFAKSFELMDMLVEHSGDPEAVLTIIKGSQLFRRSPLSTLREVTALKRYIGTSEYTELSILRAVFTAVNRLLQPSFNGEQFGNNPMSRKLNRLTDKILKSRERS